MEDQTSLAVEVLGVAAVSLGSQGQWDILPVQAAVLVLVFTLIRGHVVNGPV